MSGEATPTAVVAGWIGSTNLGDELLALALAARLRSRGIEPLAVSTDTVGTRRELGLEAVGHRRLREGWSAVRNASVLFLGGGGLLQDSTSHLNVPYHLARPWLAGRLGVPFAGVGLGAGPLRTAASRSLVRRVLRQAVAIAVRDGDSAALLRSLGLDVTEAADLALSLPVPEVPVTDHVIVCLRPPVHGGFRPTASRTHEHPGEWVGAAADALDTLARRTDLAPRFLAMQTDRDRAVHDQVGRLMETEPDHIDADVHTVLRHLASARLVVGMRYHAGIGALLGARPAVMLGYSPKVDSLVGEVGRGFVGLGATAGDLTRMADAAEAALAGADAVADARARLQERERHNDDVIDRALAAAGPGAP